MKKLETAERKEELRKMLEKEKKQGDKEGIYGDYDLYV